MLFQIQDLFFYFFTTIRQSAFNRIFTDFQCRRNILYRHLFIVKHTDHDSLIFRNLIQDFHYQTTNFFFIHRHFRIHIRTDIFY